MFICAITKKVSSPREPEIKIISEVRFKTYRNEIPDPLDEFGESTITKESKGWEIAKEVSVCQEGFEILKAQKLLALDKMGNPLREMFNARSGVAR